MTGWKAEGLRWYLWDMLTTLQGKYLAVFTTMKAFSLRWTVWGRYIHLYGLPKSLYLDKHSTYKTTRQPDLDELLRGEAAATQFERACRELEIRIIHAHSPQAKGRIERVFGTLQDRLIKEMRLAGVSSIEEANAFSETFLPVYNERFAIAAKKQGDLLRP